jgi:hypothetical protein
MKKSVHIFGLVFLLFSQYSFCADWNYDDSVEGNIVYIDNIDNHIERINLIFEREHCNNPDFEVIFNENFSQHEKIFYKSKGVNVLKHSKLNSLSFIFGGIEYAQNDNVNLLTFILDNKLSLKLPMFFNQLKNIGNRDLFLVIYTSLNGEDPKIIKKIELPTDLLKELVSSAVANCEFNI